MIDTTTTTPEPGTTRAKGGLSTWKIVFFVIAATTPMAAMVGTVPYGFALGTGAGLPAMYLIAGAVMLCFITGYAAMSRNVVNTGALYTYIRAGLGRIPGAGAAYLAVLSYATFTIGVAGVFGYFGHMMFGGPWPAYSAGLVLLMAVLGRRQLSVSVALLGFLMCAEIAVILLTDTGIAIHRGAAALPAVSFSPSLALGAGIAAAATFAFTSFIGIESAPLYGEEARDPRKSVARASYWAVALITVFYTMTSWLAVGGIGAGNVSARAAKEGGSLFFSLTTQYTASAVTAVMAILLVTSFVATGVAVHNATSRYLFALGREGLLPHWLGERHPKHGSPARASAVQAGITGLAIAGFAVAGLDPYTNLGVSMISLATAGLMVLMLGASIAAIVYFVRKPADRHWWRTATAPALSVAGLGAATVLVLGHYKYLTGTTSVVVNGLPWLILVALAAGMTRALWLRTRTCGRWAAMHPEAVAVVAPKPAFELAGVAA
jgi:amino acid transporter